VNRGLKVGRPHDSEGCEDVPLVAGAFSWSLIDIDYLRMFSVDRNIQSSQNSSRASTIDLASMFLLARDTASNPHTIITGVLILEGDAEWVFGISNTTNS
jgi:hypothetical protein